MQEQVLIFPNKEGGDRQSFEALTKAAKATAKAKAKAKAAAKAAS